jgi:hypothetical protein
MPAKKNAEGKKPYPFNDGQPNENAAIRVIRVVKPECPVDPTPELRQKDGTYRPNPRYTGEQNCMQLHAINNQGRWDVSACEDKGHDPWHTVFYRQLVEDVYDEDGNFLEQKIRMRKEVRINIIAVSLNIRHTSGTELLLAKARGCLTLDEYGALHPEENFTDPCEFRACTQPVQLLTRFGNFCSERHARLIAADVRQIPRFVSNERDPGEAFQKARSQEAEEQLESINLGIRYQ